MPKPSPTKIPSFFSLLALGALGCAANDSHAAPKAPPTPTAPEAQASATAPTPPETAEALRSQGPKGLAIALARFDALAEGEAKEKQAALVDEVAAQRYATVSRLFWHTDLELAKSASNRSGKPVLSLRLLGRLDEDYSCANSRLFRTVLYANQEVSSYLRDNFTLHWSSEREVPKVTIDFGNGRTMKTTMAGNSAHYILDQEGRPVDILPGLYGPKSFVAALKPGRKLALRMRNHKDAGSLVRSYHQKREAQAEGRFKKLSAQQQAALMPYRSRSLFRELMAAEMLTVTKAAVEVPLVRTASLGATSAGAPDSQAVEAAVTKTEALDTSSKKLIESMGPTDWGTTPAKLRAGALEQVYVQLQRRVAGDTLINEYSLRPMVTRLFLQQETRDFDTLNTILYSEIFVTPRNDSWLGMAQPRGFTGLPADGLKVSE